MSEQSTHDLGDYYAAHNSLLTGITANITSAIGRDPYVRVIDIDMPNDTVTATRGILTAEELLISRPEFLPRDPATIAAQNEEQIKAAHMTAIFFSTALRNYVRMTQPSDLPAVPPARPSRATVSWSAFDEMSSGDKIILDTTTLYDAAGSPYAGRNKLLVRTQPIERLFTVDHLYGQPYAARTENIVYDDGYLRALSERAKAGTLKDLVAVADALIDPEPPTDDPELTELRQRYARDASADELLASLVNPSLPDYEELLGLRTLLARMP